MRYRMGYIYVEQFTHPDQVRHVLVDAKDTYIKGEIWDKLKPLVGNGIGRLMVKIGSGNVGWLSQFSSTPGWNLSA